MHRGDLMLAAVGLVGPANQADFKHRRGFQNGMRRTGAESGGESFRITPPRRMSPSRSSLPSTAPRVAIPVADMPATHSRLSSSQYSAVHRIRIKLLPL